MIRYDQSCIYYPDAISKSKFKKGYTQNNPRVLKKYRDISEEGNFYGGERFHYIKNIDLSNLLSSSEKYIYIPVGSYIIVEFNDGLKNYPDYYDLIINSCTICSCGKRTIDSALISISSDNKIFTPLGVIHSFESLGFNIEKYNDPQKIKYVKIEGLSAIAFPYGFELLKVFGFKDKPIIIQNNNTLGTHDGNL